MKAPPSPYLQFNLRRSWMTALLALLIGGALPTTAILAADSVPNVAGTADVSADFRAEFQRAAATIPRPIWNGLSRRGWNVRLTRFLSDALPHLRDEQPRGWPRGRSWDSVEAIHLPKSRTVIVAEHFRSDDGDRVSNQRVAGVLRHEVGHAFDMFAGREQRFHSASSEFGRAYTEDVAAMSSATKKKLHYFLQRGAPGRQETFAEAFAIALGGGSDEPNFDEFREAFPRVMRNVQATIARFAPQDNSVAQLAQ